MVESSGLLNRRTGKTGTGGSNPPLSARAFLAEPNETPLSLLTRNIPVVEQVHFVLGKQRVSRVSLALRVWVLICVWQPAGIGGTYEGILAF